MTYSYRLQHFPTINTLQIQDRFEFTCRKNTIYMFDKVNDHLGHSNRLLRTTFGCPNAQLPMHHNNEISQHLCAQVSSLPCLWQKDFILSKASTRDGISMAKVMRTQFFNPNALPVKYIFFLLRNTHVHWGRIEQPRTRKGVPSGQIKLLFTLCLILTFIFGNTQKVCVSLH